MVGHQDERQARALGFADAPGVVERLAGAEQESRDLGDVERRAAAEARDAGRAGLASGGDRRQERRLRGVGLDAVEDGDRGAGRFQRLPAPGRRARARGGRDR